MTSISLTPPAGESAPAQLTTASPMRLGVSQAPGAETTPSMMPLPMKPASGLIV